MLPPPPPLPLSAPPRVSRAYKNIVCPSPVTLAASKTKTTRHSLRIASALSILYRNQSNILVMVHSSFTTSFKLIQSECVSYQLINRTTQHIKSKSTTFKTNYNLSKQELSSNSAGTITRILLHNTTTPKSKFE